MAVGWRREKRPEKSLQGPRECLHEALGEKIGEGGRHPGVRVGGCFATHCEREHRRSRCVDLQGEAKRNRLNRTFLDRSRTSA